MFRAGDFSDPSGFAKKLRAHTDPVSKYVWGRFSTEEKKDLTEKTELVREIVILQSALNRILATGPIHNATRFAKVVLSDATLRLLRSAKTGIEVLRLNRLLLEDAYPDEIAKLPNCDRQVGCESPLEYRRELLRTAIFACNLLALPFACKVQDADLAPFEEGWPVVLSAAKERAGEWKKAKERVGALRAGEKHPARHDARIGGEFADFVNGWIDFALILFFRGRGASYALTGAGLDHLWKIVEASFELMLGFEWQDHPVVMQQFRSRNFWVAGDNRKWEKCSRGHKRDVVRDKFEGAARTIKSRLQRAKGSDSG